MKLRDYIIDLFRNFDGDKNTDFILKYPHVWKNCFDIEEQSRYHRVMIDSALVGFDACEAHYLPIIEKLEGALNDITEFNIRIEHSRFDSRSFQDIAKQALAELAEFKNKMNGDK